MKKVITACLALSIAFAGFGQKPVTIEGSFSGDNFSEVKLFKVKEGEAEIIANSKPSEAGKFGFLFSPDYEGFYLVGTGASTSPMGNYRFWLKPGDELTMVLTDSTYELAGKNNSKENQVLYDWYRLTWPVEWKSVYFNRTRSTYVDFFPVLEKTVAEAKVWLAQQKGTKNKKFNAILPELVKFDMAYYAVNFLNTPRSAHPDKEEIPEYYAGFTVNQLFPQTGTIYSQPYGKRAFSTILMREQLSADVRNKEDRFTLTTALSLISNDTLKGDYILSKASGIKDYSEYLKTMKQYDEYIITEGQKEREFKINAALATLKPGDQGYEFKYEDKDGKMVSFSDLKGKVVLIDTWATWCAPCKVEIPHLKKLEEEMKGKDVAIVSLSVDEEKDKEKWLQMIKDENLGGIQLFAKGWNDFVKYYKITGIPRFLVFDKEGKIVTVDAPRPSSPNLKPLLEKYLEKP